MSDLCVICFTVKYVDRTMKLFGDNGIYVIDNFLEVGPKQLVFVNIRRGVYG